MFKFLFVFISASVNILCYSQDATPGYCIDGRIGGLRDGSTIFLIDGAARRRIDSAVVKGDRFLMKGKLHEPIHTYLYLGKTNKLADILLDNRAIKVEGAVPIYDSIKVIGSDIDVQWKKWYQHDQRIGYQKYRLDELFKSLIDKDDLENAGTVKRLSEELMTDRINLLKDYVKRYNDSASGALLPTLCTIQTNLVKSDYLEMYNSLTPRMRSTTFGKNILDLADKSRTAK
jgi:hypothetical protein